MGRSRLEEYIEAAVGRFGEIPKARKEQLRELAGYVDGRVRAGKEVRLTFICTHNSRRSHFAQIWAQAAAWWYGVPGVVTFSGGTEVTAFNPRAVAAVVRAGFEVETIREGDNPVYRIKAGADRPAMEAWSKVYGDPANPQEDYCAVMTCSSADRNCPVVFGSSIRVPLTYEDPKAYDGTARETEAYDERCRQIGGEMLYLFSRVDRSARP